MKKVLLLLFICLSATGFTQDKEKIPLYPTYKGLVMSGYQGWFRADGDKADRGWGHYGRGSAFDAENNTIDIWPDVSEYKKTYKTSFSYPDGSSAKVFSSLDESTTDLHFKWMKEYGVDGVFMQRFYGVTRGGDHRKHADEILSNAFKASQKYDRAIAVMYDLSGLRPGADDCSRVIEDWKHLVDDLKVKDFGDKQTYLHHRGKPLVTIWGVGFPDRPYNIREIGLNRLIDFLKNDLVYGGCTVMLGVPTHFRELDKDCLPDPYLHEIIESADVVLPWMVQRFTPLVHKPMTNLRDHIIADIKWTSERGVDYVPIACPGFSWRNLSLSNPDLARYTAYGAIPRLGGQFYWDQLVTMINAGAEMIYVAMFDEIDEGTAIFKVSDNPPNSDKAHFIDNDGMPSDHYLYLTGQGARMLRKEIPLQQEMPVR
ncbi:MAG: glycoside hydrolase family 71/99-like protein [Bacteroidales bacterium]